jgi:hypothetical protein
MATPVLDTMAPRTASPSTIKGVYRPKVEHWISPRIGAHRLDKLRPEHLDAFYLDLAAGNLGPESVLMIHQIISRALRMAMRRGLVGRNPPARTGRGHPRRPADPRPLPLAATKRYTHVTDQLAHDAADRIGRALWRS